MQFCAQQYAPVGLASEDRDKGEQVEKGDNGPEGEAENDGDFAIEPDGHEDR